MADPASLVVDLLRSWQEMAPFASFLLEHGWFPEADLSCLPLDESLAYLVCRGTGGIRNVLGARLEETEMAWRVGPKVVGRSRVRQINLDYGMSWGELDDASADALVAGVWRMIGAGEGDVARFGYLPEGGPLARAVRRSSFLFRDHFPMKNRRWQRPMPETYEALLAEHGKNTRKKVKSIQNRLSKAFDTEYRVWTRPEDLERALADVRLVDRATYQNRIGAGFDPDALAMAKLRRLCDEGALRIYILYLNERPAAFYLGYLYRGAYWGHYTGFDDEFRDYRPGTAVFHFVMQDLCAQGGCRVMDFGLGDSGYKEVYARHNEMHVELMLFRRSWRGLGLLLARETTGLARAVTYGLMEKTGLLKALKARWRRKQMDGEAGGEQTPATTP